MKSQDKQPRVFENGKLMRDAVRLLQHDGKRVGLVPTMGALHPGHMSLVDASVKQCDYTIATIFVNPTQFNKTSDLEKYPRNLQADLEMLAKHGCDAVFTPPLETMYSPKHETYVEVGETAKAYEGAHRQGHFRGVATIVLKLFQLVPADEAFFGQKDYQQTLVIRRMIEDLNLPIEMNVCPTVRESDGLAMSSRNARLATEERKQAACLAESLLLAERLVKEGEDDTKRLLAAMNEHIAKFPLVHLEYLDIVEAGTIVPVQKIKGPTVAIIAAQLGTEQSDKTWLIDNTIIG